MQLRKEELTGGGRFRVISRWAVYEEIGVEKVQGHLGETVERGP